MTNVAFHVTRVDLPDLAMRPNPTQVHHFITRVVEVVRAHRDDDQASVDWWRIVCQVRALIHDATHEFERSSVDVMTSNALRS